MSIFAVVFLAFGALAACEDSAGDDAESDDDGSTAGELAAATDSQEDNEGGTLNVVVTMPFMPSMVEAVGGDLVEIASIVPDGVDANSYQPSPGDAQLIADADVIFVNGGGLEEFLADLIDSAGDVDAPVIELADGLEHDDSGSEDHDDRDHNDHEDDNHEESEGDDHDHDESEGDDHDHGDGDDGHDHGDGDDDHEDHEDEHHEDDEEHDDDHEHEHDHEGGNPHFWLDPGYGIHYVENIAAGLSEVDSRNEDAYQENADSYITEIEEFDEWAREEMTAIPEENRSMVTFHDAFPHFAEHFGLEIIGVVISSPGREPGAQEVAQLADEIQDVGVPAVFIEPQFNAEMAESIADEAGVQTVLIYSDTPPEGAGYLEMMELNVDNVVEGLS